MATKGVTISARRQGCRGGPGLRKQGLTRAYVFGSDYSEKFVEWGFPPKTRFVVDGLELIAAVLLVLPRRESNVSGTAMLGLVPTGAVTTHLIDDAPFWQGTWRRSTW
ncbi:DoxX family protein [Nocardia sp. CA-084685]|uniref:DoxX family protein n=1 Tax=Nocardia sp. CA-084685 TaxID=3239970 RepID=UPI003D95164E